MNFEKLCARAVAVVAIAVFAALAWRQGTALHRLEFEVQQLRGQSARPEQVQVVSEKLDRLQRDLQAAQNRAVGAGNTPSVPVSPAEMARLRAAAQQNACINNLRQLDGGKAQWALENKKKPDDAVTLADIIAYFRGGRLPACPAGGTYSVTDVMSNPTCSIPGHTL